MSRAGAISVNRCNGAITELLLIGEIPLALACLALAAVAVGAIAQAVTGIGFALIAGPPLIAAFGPARGIASTLVLACAANLVPLAVERRHVQVRKALVLLIPAGLVTPLVALALSGADDRTGAILAGAAILIATAMLASGARWEGATGPISTAAAGAASGAMNYIGAVGGPAVALFADNAGWPPREARATLQAYLLGSNLITLAALGFVLVPIDLVAALAVGAGIGVVIGRRIPDRGARTATLWIAGLGGATLVVGGLA